MSRWKVKVYEDVAENGKPFFSIYYMNTEEDYHNFVIRKTKKEVRRFILSLPKKHYTLIKMDGEEKLIKL